MAATLLAEPTVSMIAMNFSANFMRLLLFTGVVIVVDIYCNWARAQSMDAPPERIATRLAEETGNFRNLVASADGQVIAFYNRGVNHLAGLPPLPSSQVIVIDRRANTIELASRTPSGGFQNANAENFVSISRDGRTVAFASSATNLDPRATTPGVYTYIYDRNTQQVRALNVDSFFSPGRPGAAGRMDGGARKLVFLCVGPAGLPLDGPEAAFCERQLDDNSLRVVRTGINSSGFDRSYVLSSDGQWLAFAHRGPVLTSGAPNPNRVAHVYLVEVSSGATELISAAPDGSPGDNDSGYGTSIALSQDGDFIAFNTVATNIAPGVAPPGNRLLIHQRSTGRTKVAGSVGGFGILAPHLSADGLRMFYLDYNTFGFNRLAYVYDWETNQARSVAEPLGGRPNAFLCGAQPQFLSPPETFHQGIAISGDGRTVVFGSLASNLFPGDTTNSCDLFAQRLAPVPQPPQAPMPAPIPVPGPDRNWLALLALSLALCAVWLLRRG